jgi:hypothetical protein
MDLRDEQSDMSETLRKGRRSERLSRRDFLALAAGVATAPLLGSTIAEPSRAQGKSRAAHSARPGHNILFIFTDQERYFFNWPPGLSLPAHERLKRAGTTFTTTIARP